MQEMQLWSLGWADPLKKEMVTHSSILTWEIPWTEEPSGLQSMGLRIVRHDLVTKQYNTWSMSKVLQKNSRVVPGGSVVKNLPSNAEDSGSIPCPGTNMPRAMGNLPLHGSYWALPL